MKKEKVMGVFLAFLASTFLPILDVITDVYTGISLIQDGYIVGGSLVLAFIWTPCIVYLLNQRYFFQSCNADVAKLLSPAKFLLKCFFKIILWPFYFIFIISKTFFYFAIGHHADYDQKGEVEEVKLAEVCFEAAPQAVLQTFLVFLMKNAGDDLTIFQKIIKAISIVSSIVSLTQASFTIVQRQNLITNGENILTGTKEFKLLHTFSSIAGGIILWAAMTFILEEWVVVAITICYLSAIAISIMLKFSNRFQEKFSFRGTPPFFWVPAYVIGFCLPKRERGALAFGALLSVGIFSGLVQECILELDYGKFNKTLDLSETDFCGEGQNGFDLFLWTPFSYVIAAQMFNIYTLVSLKVSDFIHILQIMFSIGFVILVFVIV